MRKALACFALAAALEYADAFSATPSLAASRIGGGRAVTSIGAPTIAPRARAAPKLRMSTAPTERTVRAPVFDEVCEQTGITLSRYMMEVARANPDLRDLESLMGGIQQACKTIANLVDRATITGMVSQPPAGRCDAHETETEEDAPPLVGCGGAACGGGHSFSELADSDPCFVLLGSAVSGRVYVEWDLLYAGLGHGARGKDGGTVEGHKDKTCEAVLTPQTSVRPHKLD